MASCPARSCKSHEAAYGRAPMPRALEEAANQHGAHCGRAQSPSRRVADAVSGQGNRGGLRSIGIRTVTAAEVVSASTL